MRLVYRLWLWLTGYFRQLVEGRVKVILGVALSIVVLVSLVSYVFILLTGISNGDKVASRHGASSKGASASIRVYEGGTFAKKFKHVSDSVYSSVSANPSDGEVRHELTLLAGMNSSDSIDKVKTAINWRDDIRDSVGVVTKNSYEYRLPTLNRLAKTYNNTFETYVGIFDVVSKAYNGNEINSTVVVTLTYSDGVAVAWSVKEDI